jgi:hypothetical protein
MSFFETLKAMGLFPNQQGQAPQGQPGQPPQAPVEDPYGLDPATRRMLGWQTLGNMSQQLLALSQQMTPEQRSRMMANVDFSGGYQQNLLNAQQMRLIADKRRQQIKDQQAQEQLGEMIKQLPPGRQRDAAMFYLQAGDIGKAGEVIYGTGAAQEPVMKTIRVGTKDVTYQLDPATNQWKVFQEGEAFKPDGPPDGPKPSDRLALYKDYENAPETQSYNTLSATLGSLSQSIDDPSKVSDLDFIYGVAKALDPTSVVRESEGQMVVQSQGMAPSLLGRINGLLGGGELTPAKRRELYSLVERRAREYRKQAQTRRDYTLHVGDGIITNEDLRPLPEIPILAPPPGSQPQTVAPGTTVLPRPRLTRVEP